MKIKKQKSAKLIIAALSAIFLFTLNNCSGNTQSPVFATKFHLKHGRILLPFSINGKGKHMAILDTGAPIHAFAKGIVQKKLQQDKAQLTISGVGKNSEQTANLSKPLAIVFPPGNFCLEKQQGVIISLSEISQFFFTKIDGILGCPLLSKIALELDFSENSMVFHTPDTFAIPESYQELPINLDNGVPIVDAIINAGNNNVFPCKLMIDTGAEGSSLNSPFVRLHNLNDLLQVKIEGFEGGIGNLTATKIARLESMKVGNITFKLPTITLSQTNDGVTATNKFDGIIGLDILVRLNILLDYPHKRIFIKSNKNLNMPFEENMAGISIVVPDLKTNSRIIHNVKINSPAFIAGLKKNDQLIEINELEADKLLPLDFKRIFTTPDKQIRLKVLRDSRLIEFSFTTKRLL